MAESEKGEGVVVGIVALSDQGVPPRGRVADGESGVLLAELVELDGEPGSLVAADGVVTEAGAAESGLEGGDPRGRLLFGDDGLTCLLLRRPDGSGVVDLGP